MKQLAAVIVETRNVMNLAQIIRDHMEKLPPNTDLHIFTYRENNYLKKLFPEAIFTMLKFPFGLEQYNRLFTSMEFWDVFRDHYQRVLIFQHDSEILRPGIEEFYQWDYIGAPWKWNDRFAGNGGLSLRNPAIMHEIVSRYPWNGQLNEDHWLCMHMDSFKIGKLAPVSEAAKFSVEGVFQMGTFGAHGIDIWLTPAERDRIRNQYNT